MKKIKKKEVKVMNKNLKKFLELRGLTMEDLGLDPNKDEFTFEEIFNLISYFIIHLFFHLINDIENKFSFGGSIAE